MESLQMQNNTLAEKALLAAVMLDPKIFDQVSTYLSVSDFFSGKHRAIWQAMVTMRNGQHDFNPVSLWSEITRKGQAWEFANGAAELGEYIDGMPIFSRFESVREYCELVLRSSISREMVRMSSQTQAVIADGEVDTFEVIAEQQRKLKLLEGRRMSQSWATAYSSLREAYAELEATANGNRPDVVSTGFPAINDLLINRGLVGGSYFLVAARTSRGKSTMALQMAIGAVRHDPSKVVAYFTVEMAPVELLKRAIAIECRVPYQNFREGKFSRSELLEYARLEGESERWQFPIVCKGQLTPATIYGECARIKQEYGRLDLAIVDHIGLLRPDGKAETRARELGKISADLKALFVDLNVAGIVPTQINREGGKSERIALHHLRDSGDLEQDADIVGIINHTQEYEFYNEVGFDVAKQRNGKIGVVPMRFDTTCGRFEAAGEAMPHSQFNWKSQEDAAYWKK